MIIKSLLRYGADVNLLTHKGESPADLAHNREVLELVTPNGTILKQHNNDNYFLLGSYVPVRARDPLPITPHYLEHQEFPYSKRREEMVHNELLTQMDYSGAGYKRRIVEQQCCHGSEQIIKKMNSEANTDNVLMIKCRIAGGEDDDFIEVEVAPPTFSNLLHSCCEELQINDNCVHKLRKLPNVIIRNDKDVVRLVPYQEIELVLK